MPDPTPPPGPAPVTGNAAAQAQAPAQIQAPVQAQSPAQALAPAPAQAQAPAAGPVHAVTGNVPVPASGAAGAPAPAAAPPDPEKLEALRTTLVDADGHFVNTDGPVPLMVRHEDGVPAFAVLEEQLVPFDDWRKAGSPVGAMPAPGPASVPAPKA